MGIRGRIKRSRSTVEIEDPRELEYQLLASGWRTEVEVLSLPAELSADPDLHYAFRVSLTDPDGLRFSGVGSGRRSALRRAAAAASFL